MHKRCVQIYVATICVIAAVAVVAAMISRSLIKDAEIAHTPFAHDVENCLQLGGNGAELITVEYVGRHGDYASYANFYFKSNLARYHYRIGAEMLDNGIRVDTEYDDPGKVEMWLNGEWVDLESYGVGSYMVVGINEPPLVQNVVDYDGCFVRLRVPFCYPGRYRMTVPFREYYTQVVEFSEGTDEISMEAYYKGGDTGEELYTVTFEFEIPDYSGDDMVKVADVIIDAPKWGEDVTYVDGIRTTEKYLFSGIHVILLNERGYHPVEGSVRIEDSDGNIILDEGSRSIKDSSGSAVPWDGFLFDAEFVRKSAERNEILADIDPSVYGTPPKLSRLIGSIRTADIDLEEVYTLHAEFTESEDGTGERYTLQLRLKFSEE